MLRHAAENQFAESRMAIRPRDDDTRTDVGSYSIQLKLWRPVPVIVRHDSERNTVARQPGHNVPDPRLGSRPAVASFNDLRDRDVSSLRSIGRESAIAPSCFQRILPRTSTLRKSSQSTLSGTMTGPARLHDQVFRLGRCKRIRQRSILSPGDDNGRRTVLPEGYTAPESRWRSAIHVLRTILCRLAKLRFQFLDALF